MCGIFCAIAVRGETLRGELGGAIDTARCVMSARGPDSFGVFQSEDNRVLLMHSRLAIRGLDDEYNQPYRCSDGSVLAYNGELYNAKKLESTLGLLTTPSDTPVFAEYIVREKFNNAELDGMYAYVRYEERSGRVFVGRDLFGEKPLYKLQHGDYLFFFSEVKYLEIVKEICGYQPLVRSDFLKRFFVYGYRQAKHCDSISAWEDVKEVSPGTIGIVDIASGVHNSLRSESIAEKYSIQQGNKPQTKEEVRDVLINAIKSRAVSDVQTGISLSGGVDSNVIAAILSQSDCPPKYAFTLFSSDPRYSEYELAAQSASALGHQHEKVCIDAGSNSPVAKFLELSKNRATPFLTMTSFVSWFVARAAKERGVKVMFSGLGGDEFFSGYYDYFFYRMTDDTYSDDERLAFEKEVLPHIKNPVMKYGTKSKERVCQLDHHYYDKQLRCEFLKRSVDIPTASEVYLPKISRLRSRMFSDLSSEVIPVVLHEDDINYMSCSIENRSPFMSSEVLSVSLSLQDNELMRGGYQKVFLRELLESYGMDYRHIYQNTRKQGYNYGIRDLISADPGHFMEIVMADTLLWNYLSRGKVEDYLKTEERKQSESVLFLILSLQSYLIGAAEMQA